MDNPLAKLRAAATGQEKPLQDLKQKFGEAKNSAAQYLSVWELNRAFFSGHQWVYWNRTKIERPILEPESSRVLIEDNRITGIVRAEIAKMTKQRPTYQVTPTTGEADDAKAAETGEKILRFLWKHLGLRVKLEDTLLWSRVCGAGFWKVCWDPGAGETFAVVFDSEGGLVKHPETGAPMKPTDYPEGVPEGHEVKSLATGELGIEVVSPFEVFPDPLAKTMDDCEWLVQASVHSRDYVRKRFGVSMTPDVTGTTGAQQVSVPSEAGTTYKGIKVHEYWERPTAGNPLGRRCVWAKDTVLEDGPNPYRKLPYVAFRSIPVPGRFWPMAIIELLRGPQVELNKIKSQIIENVQRMGNPAVLMATSANTKMSGVPGEIVFYDDSSMNAVPKYLIPPTMPQYVVEQISRIEQSMQEISGQHEVSQAQVPPGVKAASAINLLQEADDTRLGPAIYDMEEALASAGTMSLEIIATHWTDERVVMIAGENHALDAMVFRGAALRENTKVEVQTGSMLPQSKAARQAAIQDFLGLTFQYEGAAPINPRFLAKTLKDLDVGGLEKFYGDVDQDESQVNRENQKLAHGEAVKINVYDNHQAHVEGHVEWQKSAAYDALPKLPKILAELHTREHREHLVAQMGEQQDDKKTPSESINYKDAPPDIKRQIEEQAGLEPSHEEGPSESEEKQTKAEQPPAKEEGTE